MEERKANSYHLEQDFLDVGQFLRDVTDRQTGENSGSVENRARFAREVVDKVVKKVRRERTAILGTILVRFRSCLLPFF